MTKSSKAKLEYQREYNKRKDVQDRRVETNRARRAALRDGTVKKGDDTNVDHKIPLDKGGKDVPSNRRVVSESENKGWRKKHPEMYGKRR